MFPKKNTWELFHRIQLFKKIKKERKKGESEKEKNKERIKEDKCPNIERFLATQVLSKFFKVQERYKIPSRSKSRIRCSPLFFYPLISNYILHPPSFSLHIHSAHI
jgi:hypothetical protein